MNNSTLADTLLLLGQDKSPHEHSIRVTVLSGPDIGLHRTFSLPKVLIGRASNVDFLLTDPTVSLIHLELSPLRSGVLFVDLKSRNGVNISGVQVEKGIAPSGCQIQLGTTAVRVELEKPFPIPTAAVSQYGALLGGSVLMRQLFAKLDKLAPTPLSVVLQGETGVGKELVAQALHLHSARAKQKFVVLDCSTLQPELAASKLFGHEKGAFTGAQQRRVGVFEEAAHGTLFLDEVGELSPELQKMLLRTLEAWEVIPLGSHQARPIDVRVLAASHRDLRAMVNRGQFREDLYYRLAQATLHIPSLAERSEDIPILARHFLAQLPRDHQCARSIASDALAVIERRSFPGNVRELKNLIRGLAYVADGHAITCSDLAKERIVSDGPTDPRPAVGTAEFTGRESFRDFKSAKQRVVDEFEQTYLIGLMRVEKSLSAAAELAGIERHSLRHLLRKHGLKLAGSVNA